MVVYAAPREKLTTGEVLTRPSADSYKKDRVRNCEPGLRDGDSDATRIISDAESHDHRAWAPHDLRRDVLTRQ